ncbi:MAG: hypothetical protein Gaeavirus5_11 [Gaeavirus sp.]|uniref:Uncharacterized protein n=1 Tax=Gaeavirus sp. TaxID=2487767 RepID=A0A3G5A0H9_9VIRU|nr:MAG: hypothetical protein Gaeavirus5_11 [Gaeavirus sp.]
MDYVNTIYRTFTHSLTILTFTFTFIITLYDNNKLQKNTYYVTQAYFTCIPTPHYILGLHHKLTVQSPSPITKYKITKAAKPKNKLQKLSIITHYYILHS